MLLAHPGGPFFKNRDLGDWTIPKGEPDGHAEPLDVVARREFAEETGTPIDPAEPTIPLGTIVQKGGKIVHAWAVEGDLDPAEALSNTFAMEWPPRSGRPRGLPRDRPGRLVRAGRGTTADQGIADPIDRPARGCAGRVGLSRPGLC